MTALKKCVDELTTCAICLEQIVDPKSLPCLHPFCMKCIRRHCESKSPGSNVACPICRSPFVLPQGGVEQLTCHFFIMNLVEANAAASGTGISSQTGLQCDVCSEDGDVDPPNRAPSATVYCSGCGQKLCARCSQTHQKIPGGAHRVVPFGGDVKSDLLKLRGSFCTVHPGNKLDIYCITCHSNICVTCHATKHIGHDCRDINDIYETFNETLGRDVEHVIAKESSLRREMKNVEFEHEKYVEGVAAIERDLLQNAHDLKALIDEAVRRTMSTLSHVKTLASKVTAGMKDDLELAISAAQSFTRYSCELLNSGRPGDVTQAYNELHERANELLKSGTRTRDGCFPEIEVTAQDLYDTVAEVVVDKSTFCRKKSDQQLAQVTRLATTDKLKLVYSSTETRFIDGPTLLNNELYVLCGNVITVHETKTYDVRRSLHVPGFGRVGDMTSCTRHRCIYVSDCYNEVVHRVKSERAITQWLVGDEPGGLSVNSVGNVLVTCPGVGRVKEFTTGGRLMRVISLQSDVVHPSHAVELTAGRIVVCHGNRRDRLHRVCIVDATGSVLLSYGGGRGCKGRLNTPIRLAVNGFIFVADCDNHRVVMLSPALTYVREVVSGLRNPCGICFDTDADRFYVADNKCDNDRWVSGHVVVYAV